MQVLLISGSLAKKSHTLALLEYIQSLFKQKDHEAILWDLKVKPLPFVQPEYHSDPAQHPDQMVRDFVAQIASADSLILGSPLYHGSYSGVLKNALDNLQGDAFAGKWVGFVGNAGSIRASHVQFTHLRQVVNTMVGYSAQTQVGTCKDDYEELADKYALTNSDMQQRCERLVNELIKNV